MTDYPDSADKDLISRAAVVKMLHEKAKSYSPSMFSTEGECYIAKVIAMEALQEVADMPAVDAEPVKHGKWMTADGMLPPEYHGKKYCSVCSEFALHDRFGREQLSWFCPNCGAKMVEEKKQS